jgi:hypothetical protein
MSDLVSDTVVLGIGSVMAGLPFRPADNPEFKSPVTGYPQPVTPMPVFPANL